MINITSVLSGNYTELIGTSIQCGNDDVRSEAYIVEASGRY